MEYLRDQVVEQTTALRSLMRNPRLAVFSVLNLAMIVFSALMMWKAMICLCNTDAPVVVVLSGSMEPAFQRGDILVLDNNARNVEVGDIVVFKVTGRDIPIVHRVIRCHDTIATGYSAITNATVSKKTKKSSGEANPWGWEDDDGLEILTKGDNNELDDRSLYAPGQRWLKRSEIVGKARASLPYVGMVTIYLNDYPMLKYVLIGLMGLFVLTTREG